MENTGIRDEVIQEIYTLAEKYNIKKVILFGSRARGDFKRTSDIDLAVSGGDFCRFALDVDEETQTLLEFDIVDLDGNVQEELLESIRKEGRILYEKEQFEKRDSNVSGICYDYVLYVSYRRRSGNMETEQYRLVVAGR